jgi:hypothetical protein
VREHSVEAGIELFICVFIVIIHHIRQLVNKGVEHAHVCNDVGGHGDRAAVAINDGRWWRLTRDVGRRWRVTRTVASDKGGTDA